MISFINLIYISAIMINLTIKNRKIIDINNKKPSIFKELSTRQICNKIRRLNDPIRVKFILFLSKNYKIEKAEIIKNEKFISIFKNLPKTF